MCRVCIEARGRQSLLAAGNSFGNGEWKCDLERGPGLFSCIKNKFATVVFDYPLRDGKAQPSAIGFAIGEKGLEYGV